MSEEEIIDKVMMIDQWKVSGDIYTQNELNAIGELLDLYNKEKEKNKKLEKEYKILEVEKVRYNIFYLESDISQTPDTAMVYYSMKKHLETLKEEKIKLEAELQELLEEE